MSVAMLLRVVMGVALPLVRVRVGTIRGRRRELVLELADGVGHDDGWAEAIRSGRGEGKRGGVRRELELGELA